MKKHQEPRKRGLAPRSLVADEGRRSALASLDRPVKSPAAAFVHAALVESVPESAPRAEKKPAAPEPAPERTLRRVSLSEIDLVNRRFQYRVTRSLSRLQESLLREGQQVPVILRGAAPPYEIVSGFGRCDAVFLSREQGKSQEDRVWADVRPALSDREAHVISVLENEDREGLSDFDRVSKAKKLKDEGYSVAEVGAVLKKSERMVQYYLSLAQAPEKIVLALKQGLLKPTHALILAQSSREALSELTPAEIEARLDDLILRCSKGASTSELRLALAKPKEHDRQPLLFPRGQGFELKAIHYAPEMPLESRRAVLEALEDARMRVLADLGHLARSQASAE